MARFPNIFSLQATFNCRRTEMEPDIRERLWSVLSTRTRIGDLALTDRLFLEEKDLVIIGGGVAGYVAAIKAGQEGLKVRVETWQQTRVHKDDL